MNLSLSYPSRRRRLSWLFVSSLSLALVGGCGSGSRASNSKLDAELNPEPGLLVVYEEEGSEIVSSVNPQNRPATVPVSRLVLLDDEGKIFAELKAPQPTFGGVKLPSVRPLENSSWIRGTTLDGADLFVDLVQKQKVRAPRLTFTGNFAGGLAPAADDQGKCGYASEQSEFKIPPQWDVCDRFIGNFAVVEVGKKPNNRVGLVDRTGKFIEKPEWIEVTQVSSTRFVFWQKDRTGMLVDAPTSRQPLQRITAFSSRNSHGALMRFTSNSASGSEIAGHVFVPVKGEPITIIRNFESANEYVSMKQIGPKLTHHFKGSFSVIFRPEEARQPPTSVTLFPKVNYPFAETAVAGGYRDWHIIDSDGKPLMSQRFDEYRSAGHEWVGFLNPAGQWQLYSAQGKKIADVPAEPVALLPRFAAVRYEQNGKKILGLWNRAGKQIYALADR